MLSAVYRFKPFSQLTTKVRGVVTSGSMPLRIRKRLPSLLTANGDMGGMRVANSACGGGHLPLPLGNNMVTFRKNRPILGFMSDGATLRDAIIYCSDFEHCKQFMMDLPWFDGTVKCPTCGATNVTWLAKQRHWKCYTGHSRPTFCLKTGTIFEGSPIPLEKWLPATWMLINCKNGISSWELHRALCVTQKTAWFMLQRIRLATQGTTHNKPVGEVEVDETFIGGKAGNMLADKRAEKITGRGPDAKAIVAAILERGGTVRPRVCVARRKPGLQAFGLENVEAGTTLNSDALKSYEGLDECTLQ